MVKTNTELPITTELSKKVPSEILETLFAEDKDLIELKKHIFDNGFTVAGVAMHIVMLCSQPLVTPATPDWDFIDRAKIPDAVLAFLKTPGYIEGMWPSLKIVMGTNIGNTSWTAEIAITLAYFDFIRILPTLIAVTKEIEK